MAALDRFHCIILVTATLIIFLFHSYGKFWQNPSILCANKLHVYCLLLCCSHTHTHIDAQTNSTVPILYKKCEVPSFLTHLYYLDYPRYNTCVTYCSFELDINKNLVVQCISKHDIV